jgi:hypothetical protein
MSSPAERRREGWKGAILVPALVLVLAGCVATPSASPTVVPTVTPSATVAPTIPTTSGSPGPTPEPPLSLALPDRRQDPRTVTVRVRPDVPGNGDGQITVIVDNGTD